MSEKSADQPVLPLLEIRQLKMYFPVKGGVFMTAKAQCKAVDGVSLVIRAGETLGLVGESGCGKSTLGKCIVRLNQPTSGEILFDGADLAKLSRSEMKPHRRNIQMIFQDPADSLNSRHTVGNILEEPFIVHGIGNEAERRARVSELLRTVGLPAGAAERFPFEFSGGQRQRLAIARALIVEPRILVLDEPTSALDVSIQKQVLDLLQRLQRERGLSYLLITHDIEVIQAMAHYVMVLKDGVVVESGSIERVTRAPASAYTRTLLEASFSAAGQASQ